MGFVYMYTPHYMLLSSYGGEQDPPGCRCNITRDVREGREFHRAVLSPILFICNHQEKITIRKGMYSNRTNDAVTSFIQNAKENRYTLNKRRGINGPALAEQWLCRPAGNRITELKRFDEYSYEYDHVDKGFSRKKISCPDHITRTTTHSSRHIVRHSTMQRESCGARYELH
jgi:hypothetical protein